MSETRHLKTPLTDSDVRSLKAGDIVYLSGIIYTGRDAAHKRMVEAIENGSPLPFELQGSAIYYVGPTPAKPDQPIGSCGPTSSYRMDPYSEALMERGLKMMIGKGPRSKEYKEQLKKYGAVYLSAIGGAGAKIQETVKKSEVIAYPDLGTEAVHKLEVENFYAIVTYDSEGNDLFEKELPHIGKQKSRIIVLIGLGFCAGRTSFADFQLRRTQKNNPIDITFDVFPSEFLGIVKDKPVYITSIGQAIDIEDFLIEVDYLNLFEYTHDNMLQPEDVPAGAVVMAIVGCSIKGLTSAHLTLEEEMARSQAFMTKTKNKEITFIAWHIGEWPDGVRPRTKSSKPSSAAPVWICFDLRRLRQVPDQYCGRKRCSLLPNRLCGKYRACAEIVGGEVNNGQ